MVTRVVEEETDWASIKHDTESCPFGIATLNCVSSGCQMFFNCGMCCCSESATRVCMIILLPLRIILGGLLGLLGIFADIIATIGNFFCCCTAPACTCEDWSIKPVYKRDAKRQRRERRTRTREGRTETYYVWVTIATWNIWDRSGADVPMGCCNGDCYNKVCCMASWQGYLIPMGGCSEADADVVQDQPQPQPGVTDMKNDCEDIPTAKPHCEISLEVQKPPPAPSAPPQMPSNGSNLDFPSTGGVPPGGAPPSLARIPTRFQRLGSTMGWSIQQTRYYAEEIEAFEKKADDLGKNLDAVDDLNPV